MNEHEKYILITGANGYIGSHVVHTLLEKNVRVTAVDLSVDFIDPRAVRIPCNLFEASVSDLFGERIPDACLHFAWKDGFRHDSAAHMEMLSSHFRFLTEMAKQGVKQLAVMGTMHEIGYHEGAVDENTPCRPLSLYGVAKNALRQSLELFCRQHEVVFQWFRGYYVIGDDERNHSVFSRILEFAKAGKREFPFTSGKKCYDFLPVEELADQLSACVMQTEIQGIINCCSGSPLALGDMAERFIRERGLDITLRYGAYPDRIYDSPAIWGNNTKIRRILAGDGKIS